MKVSKEVRKNAVDYSMNAITDICTNIGPRESGMPKEREAQEWIKNQIDTNGWADESAIEDFKVSRHALVGFTKIIGVFLIIGALLQLLTLVGNPALTLAVRIISLVLAVLSIVIVVLEFLFYVPFIDKFLPETTSCNVYAKYKPTGDVKRRIIINGHTDSAYEWTLMKIRQEVMVGVLAVDLLCALASIVIFSINIAKGVTPLWSVIFAACTVVAYIGLFFVCNFKVLSPGANDNLTGVFVAVSALKCLKESGIRYENTEVCALLTGSEEAGLRGAKAFAKAHAKEFDDVETLIFAIDTIRDAKFLGVNVNDLNNTVPSDPHAIDLFFNAGAELGIPVQKIGVPFGATDSAAFNQGGMKAVGITAMNHNLEDYYHTRKDTFDNLDEESLATCFEVAVKALENFDSGL